MSYRFSQARLLCTRRLPSTVIQTDTRSRKAIAPTTAFTCLTWTTCEIKVGIFLALSRLTLFLVPSYEETFLELILFDNVEPNLAVKMSLPDEMAKAERIFRGHVLIPLSDIHPFERSVIHFLSPW